MRKLAVLAVAVFVALPVLASDPAADLARGRNAIKNRDYSEAAQILRSGIESAESIGDAGQKKEALAALHFYAALATFHSGRDSAARSHLVSFFANQPNATRIDPKRYDPDFATLFNQVRTGRTQLGTVSFESLYPNYEQISGKKLEPYLGFRNTPEYEFLATNDERREWDDILDPAKREQFVDTFWKRRDPSPGDERNEYREEFNVRASFADYYFADGHQRGSLSDRGRIFLLLGKPGAVEVRGFKPSDGTLSFAESAEYGNTVLEIWRYPRTALPVSIPTSGVTYMFVTHPRIGDHKLHGLDGMNHRALLLVNDTLLKAAH